jgi:putative membrane protein
MRPVLLPAAALALLTFCSPGGNRRSGETGMASDSAARPTNDSASRSATDSAAGGEAVTPAAILSQLYLANTSEIQVSKVAAKKAASPAVKRMAAKLAADHAQNREEERALAQKLDVTLTPAAGAGGSATDSTGLPSDLQGKTGRDFDKAFVEHEIKDHEDNIQKIQSQLLPAASDPQIKAYLQKTLTAMQGHLTRLKQVQQQLG